MKICIHFIWASCLVDLNENRILIFCFVLFLDDEIEIKHILIHKRNNKNKKEIRKEYIDLLYFFLKKQNIRSEK